jgi:hypothetical protein
MSKQLCGRVSNANLQKVKGICESVPLPRKKGDWDLEQGRQTEMVAIWCQKVIGKMMEVGILEEQKMKACRKLD